MIFCQAFIVHIAREVVVDDGDMPHHDDLAFVLSNTLTMLIVGDPVVLVNERTHQIQMFVYLPMIDPEGMSPVANSRDAFR